MFTTAKRWKPLKGPSTGERINSTYTHTHVRKERQLTHAATRINAEDMTLSEIIQTQKVNYCVSLLTQGNWKSQIRRHKVQWWPPWAGGLETGEPVFSGDRVSAWDGEKLLEMGGGK